jgi:hypothetical protein
VGKRSDAKKMTALAVRIANILFDRLTSEECRQVLATGESGGLSLAEMLASFYRSQYSIVCKEMMEFASRHKSENLFKINEGIFYEAAFGSAVEAVYGDETASDAVRLALTPPAASFSLADELKTFAELRDSGILTETEFDAQKAKLLESD